MEMIPCNIQINIALNVSHTLSSSNVIDVLLKLRRYFWCNFSRYQQSSATTFFSSKNKLMLTFRMDWCTSSPSFIQTSVKTQGLSMLSIRVIWKNWFVKSVTLFCHTPDIFCLLFWHNFSFDEATVTKFCTQLKCVKR